MNITPRTLLRACWSPLVKRATQAYITGPELADALHVCSSLSRRGIPSTIGYWNSEGERPRQIADTYLAALDSLSAEGLDCYLTIKVWSLGFAQELLAEILERSGQAGIRVHFDSRSPDRAEQMFSLITAAFPHHARLSYSVPGRWRRSLRDADLAAELGINVRVVKGEWEDPDEPERDPRAGFLAVIDRLAGRARQVAVATHDAPLAREALRRLRTAGTPCTQELLFGLPTRPLMRVAREAGVPVRLYVPYGHAMLPYHLAQARQDPRIYWWFIRDLLLGHAFRLPGTSRVPVSGGIPPFPEPS
jgi:proline dehydrogenase